MKAKDLAEALMQYPDFEVKFFDLRVYDKTDIDYTITGIDDIAHSEKVIVLGGTEN